MDKKIVLVNYGLGSAYDNFIELNHKLNSQVNQSLRKKIIAHERRHGNEKYSMKDFKNDFQAQNSYFFESLKFALRNPECLIGFFPFMYSYYFRIMTFNLAALVPFVYFGAIFTGFFWLLFKVNPLKAFLGYSIFFVIIQIFFLIFTHKYVKSDKYFKYKELTV